MITISEITEADAYTYTGYTPDGNYSLQSGSSNSYIKLKNGKGACSISFDVTCEGYSASTISSNLRYYIYNYYFVNYLDSSWTLFYADENNIFLEHRGNLPVSEIPRSSTGLSVGDRYGCRWDTVPGFQSNWSTYKTSFMHTGYNLTNSYNNSKYVSTLLNTGNWTSFVNSSYSDYAIGSPTLEMWAARYYIASGTSSMVDCSKTNAYGYYADSTNGRSFSKWYGVEHDMFYGGDQGVSDTACFWLASPNSYDGGERVWAVGTDWIGPWEAGKYYAALRPIVRLKKGVKLYPGTYGNEFTFN